MGDLTGMDRIKERLKAFDTEIIGKSKAFKQVDADRLALIARIRKALDVIENVEGLRQVHEQEIASLRDGAGGLWPKVIEENLGLFVQLAQELSNQTWALVSGFPMSTVCVCPKSKCKQIVLPEPGGMYRHCGQLWDDFSRRKEVQGVTAFFWNHHVPGQKFRGLTPADTQEDILKGSA